MTDEDDVYLSTASQRKRYGNISAMTLWRWERDPRLNFPPAIDINGRKYRSLRALEEWERQRAACVYPPLSPTESRRMSTGTDGNGNSAAMPERVAQKSPKARIRR